MPVENQPVASVEWVKPDTLFANDYNPNHVAPPEMKLLKLSILENGWTQPIVAHATGEIVDGFHRWTLGTKDAEIRALTSGLVPVVRLQEIAPDVARMATIRHNRARGSHYVLKMADIVEELHNKFGLQADEIARRLGMDDEEVERLLDRGNSLKRNSQAGFNNGWVPSD
jgi:ParB-like chromosome segregation protein Spo0J